MMHSGVHWAIMPGVGGPTQGPGAPGAPRRAVQVRPAVCSQPHSHTHTQSPINALLIMSLAPLCLVLLIDRAAQVCAAIYWDRFVCYQLALVSVQPIPDSHSPSGVAPQLTDRVNPSKPNHQPLLPPLPFPITSLPHPLKTTQYHAAGASCSSNTRAHRAWSRSLSCLRYSTKQTQ